MSVGINKHIEFAINLLQDELWEGFNNSYNGRSFRLKKQDRTQPEIYQGSNEFTEVFVNDNYDSIVHFDIDPIRPKISASQATANVNIIFAIDLGKIYGNSTRATEEAISDINKVLVNSSFEIENIVEFPDSLADYDITEKEEHIFNMQPYYVIKFETTCTYALSAICIPITPDTFTLTLSSDDNGISITNVGEESDSPITVNKGTNIAAYAEANVGFKFNNWLKNSIEINQNPYPFVMNQDVDLVANFTIDAELQDDDLSYLLDDNLTVLIDDELWLN